MERFGRLVRFVKATSAATGGTDEPDLSTAEQIAKHFARSWRDGIDNINASVMQNFAESGGETEILKQVLIQLVLYYQRFQVSIMERFRENVHFQMLNIHRC